VPRGFLKKNEDEGRKIYEDLAEKTIQWESTPNKYRNSNPISSKGGLHFIETSIVAKAKLVA